MPRFLNTSTGEFEWHSDPSQVTYAILSHVWRDPKNGGEQSYEDVRRIQQEVKECRWAPASLDSNTNAGSDTSMIWAPFAFISLEDIDSIVPGTIFTHPGLSDKIKGFCKVAREAGFRLAWNDACCIDKTSSAELSEAINSMYEWYRLSDMCYVYLAEVPDGDPTKWNSPWFHISRWHRRGWTLQELIAPEHIIFLTRTWNVLGTKMTLARTLERITGVDFDILVGRTMLDSISVARRMSWAACRQTTRVEDRAYSLLGIFGLHMSPIYGEGKKAFLRLQEEIIRTIPDQSILAWKDPSPDRLSRNLKSLCLGGLYTDENRGLLTSSPTSFSKCFNIEPISSSSLADILDIQEGDVPPVHCIFTPEGVSMRLVCLPLSGVPEIRNAFQGPQSARDICTECRELGELDTLALLQCQERHGTGTTYICGLPLRRSCRDGARSNRRAFHIGGHFHHDNGKSSRYYHTLSMEIEELMKVLKHVRPTVEDVLLLRHYSGPLVPKSLQWSSAVPRFSDPCPWFLYLKKTVIQISPHSMDALRTLGIDPSPLQVTHLEQEIILETTLAFRCGSGAGPTDVIALRLSITRCSYDELQANVSVGRVGVVGSGSGQSSIGAAAGASHHTVVNTPHISGGFLDLDHRNDSRTVIPLNTWHSSRRTIVHVEYTVQSEGTWGNRARLLRIALQHTCASCSAEDWPRPNLWVSIDLSQMFPYVSRTESGVDSPSSQQTGTHICGRDSETSNGHDNVFPSHDSTPPSADQEHAVNFIRVDVEALHKHMHQIMSAASARFKSLTRSQRLGFDSCEPYDDDRVSPSATHRIPVMHPPLEQTMATWGTSPERSDNSVFASSITIPDCRQAGPSNVLAESQPGQNQPREASLGAESLCGSNAKRICQGSLYTYNPLANDSPPQEHSDQPIPGSETGQSCNNAGHEGRRDGSGTTANWTCIGSTGDGAAIVCEQEVQNMQSSGQSEDSSTRRAVTTFPGLAKLDSVALEDEPARSENTMHAVRDTVETLHRENDALRMQTSAMGTQIAGLEATNAETRAEMSELRAQMAQMRSLLNTLAASQGLNASQYGLS